MEALTHNIRKLQTVREELLKINKNMLVSFETLTEENKSHQNKLNGIIKLSKEVWLDDIFTNSGKEEEPTENVNKVDKSGKRIVILCFQNGRNVGVKS